MPDRKIKAIEPVLCFVMTRADGRVDVSLTIDDDNPGYLILLAARDLTHSFVTLHEQNCSDPRCTLGPEAGQALAILQRIVATGPVEMTRQTRPC